MNTDMLIVNIIVISLVFVPYLILILIGQKETRKISKRFQQEAKNHQLNISEMESWNLNYIGIDTSSQKLLFTQRRDTEFFVDLIDLKSFQEVKLVTQFEEIVNNKVKEDILLKINLEFVGHYNHINHNLCLYDYDLNRDQDYEMKHAEKWAKRVSDSLSMPVGFKRVA
ncbi:hypothetical protein SAMN03097699_1726 [Flavobacteriaceae bacterium MAR_2010_188]|nr:hypothetical protein SAMN03097699_1726 [Flavobacteriaceae bacterium MAR_2010_188]